MDRVNSVGAGLFLALAVSATSQSNAQTPSSWGYNDKISTISISGTFASNLPTMQPYQNFPYPGWPQNWSNKTFNYTTGFRTIPEYNKFHCGPESNPVRCSQIFSVGGSIYNSTIGNYGIMSVIFSSDDNSVPVYISNGDEFASPGAFEAFFSLPKRFGSSSI